MKIYAIIPSGGSGKRLGSNLPKQYLKFNNKELIAYTLDTFQNNILVDEIIISAQHEYFALIENIKSRFGLSKISKIVAGGKERQDSVFNAVKSIDANDDDLIVVHDAARPLLTDDILTETINFAKVNKTAVTAIDAKDTLVKSKSNVITNYLNRSEIRYIQTPQIFSFDIFKKAMQKAEAENFYGTDESMLVKNAGYTVKLVNGSSLNFKITNKSDLDLFQLIVSRKN